MTRVTTRRAGRNFTGNSRGHTLGVQCKGKITMPRAWQKYRGTGRKSRSAGLAKPATARRG